MLLLLFQEEIGQVVLVYDIYRHDYGEFQTGSTTAKVVSTGNKTTLFDSTFYVLNSDFNVYKCLDNNSGAQSVVQPTGTNHLILWKLVMDINGNTCTH